MRGVPGAVGDAHGSYCTPGGAPFLSSIWHGSTGQVGLARAGCSLPAVPVEDYEWSTRTGGGVPRANAQSGEEVFFAPHARGCAEHDGLLVEHRFARSARAEVFRR
jgi:hypothetical protein